MSDCSQADVPTPRMLSWARNSASYRLARRMHTEKQLRDAITRKAREKFEEISEAQVAALADVAVKFGYDHGALDDKAYAEIASRSAVSGGRSKRAIAQRLAIKGIAKETASAVTADLDDRYAALVFARKRAFGPFRKVSFDDKRKAKEYSAFARAGFASEVSRGVLSMSLEEAQDALDFGRSL